MAKTNEDLTGRQFGELTALCESSERIRNEIAYVCRCSCGEKTLATRGQLITGRKKSCGCLRKKSPPNVIDLTGQVFERLTVIKRAGKTSNDNALWECRCECGNITTANGTSLRRGDTVSCGCAGQAQINAARAVLYNDKSIDGVQIPLLTKKVRSDSGTGHKGVHKRNRRGRVYYEASITVKGRRKYLGEFVELDRAIAARKAAEAEHYEPLIKAQEAKENEQRPSEKLD